MPNDKRENARDCANVTIICLNSILFIRCVRVHALLSSTNSGKHSFLHHLDELLQNTDLFGCSVQRFSLAIAVYHDSKHLYQGVMSYISLITLLIATVFCWIAYPPTPHTCTAFHPTNIYVTHVCLYANAVCDHDVSYAVTYLGRVLTLQATVTAMANW